MWNIDLLKENKSKWKGPDQKWALKFQRGERPCQKLPNCQSILEENPNFLSCSLTSHVMWSLSTDKNYLSNVGWLGRVPGNYHGLSSHLSAWASQCRSRSTNLQEMLFGKILLRWDENQPLGWAKEDHGWHWQNLYEWSRQTLIQIADNVYRTAIFYELMVSLLEACGVCRSFL
jgi:hypothetical protein